jgi:hypothetical protein
MWKGALLAAMSVAALACGDDDGAASAPPGKALARDELVRVEIDSECARLRAGAGLDRLDEFRDAALAKLGRTQQDRALSLPRLAEDGAAREEIATKVAECRRATGWIAEPGPEGSPTWVRSSR